MLQGDAGANQTPTPRADLLATRWTRIQALHGHDAQQAWHWFVGRYRHFVRGVLRRMLARPHLADAAEQEFWGYVFMSEALQRADRDRRFRPFLAGIVRNFARSHARARGLPVVDDAALAAVEDRSSEAADLLDWTQNVVANALRALRDENGTTGLVMARFYGIEFDGEARDPVPVSAVAEELGVSAQAVYMMLFRGRKRLRALVEEEVREGCADTEAWRDELRMLLQVAAKELPGTLT